MRLILTLTGGGLSGPSTMRTLSAGSLSVGRGASNDWVLPDPEQNLSRTHCAVTAEGGRFVLTDLSSNGMHVNGAQQATERDSRIVLTDGDRFKLGDYTITATLIDDGQGSAAAHSDFGDFGSPPMGSPRDSGGPLNVDPLDDPFGQAPNPAFSHPIAHVAPDLRGADPFDVKAPRQSRGFEADDDLFRGLTPSSDWQGAPRADHAPVTSTAMPAPRVIPQIHGGDIDFDALIGDLGGPAKPAAALTARMPDPFAGAPDPFAHAPDPFAHAPDPFAHAPAPPHAPPPAAPPAPPPPPAARPPEPDHFAALAPRQAPPPIQAADLDPFAEPGDAPHAWAAPAAAPQRAVPPLPAPPPFAPPPTAAPPPPVLAAAPPPAAAPAGADAMAAFAAFLEGAGIAANRVDNKDPEAALRAAGQIFRAMTEGLRDVLVSRATIKSEMRIEQTMIASHGNNALKFSVTADDAVAGLLTAKRPGYMEPLAAAKEAFSDVKSHEIAVMAGVQTALLALLKRFDPDELEKRLTNIGLGAILPGARKARYWDMFRQTYGDISREAEDDFQSVFGRSFAKAYTAQARKD